METQWKELLLSWRAEASAVVPYQSGITAVVTLDLSTANRSLNSDIYNDLHQFCLFIQQQLEQVGARYGIGGYLENRELYARSQVFAGNGVPRSLHLGLDIWCAAGTPVRAPLSGKVHSTGFHSALGNYGGTIILEHEISGHRFYSLYGHLTQKSTLHPPGLPIFAGQTFAELGDTSENGGWPPHLHWQIITDLGNWWGDFPGVCAITDRLFYEAICPNPLWLAPAEWTTTENLVLP